MTTQVCKECEKEMIANKNQIPKSITEEKAEFETTYECHTRGCPEYFAYAQSIV